MNNYRLVYSSDPKLNERCPRCKEVLSECSCPKKAQMPDSISGVLQLEKAHRGGKTVTVLKKLPPVEDFLKHLAKELKQQCGCGGTYGIAEEMGYVEIQGDRRELLREYLPKKGIKVKG